MVGSRAEGGDWVVVVAVNRLVVVAVYRHKGNMAAGGLP